MWGVERRGPREGMGEATVWREPTRHNPHIKNNATLDPNRSNKDPARHAAGVSFNWDKVCGCVEPEERDPILYNATYPQRFERFKAAGRLARVDVAGVKALLDKSGAIGGGGEEARGGERGRRVRCGST